MPVRSIPCSAQLLILSSGVRMLLEKMCRECTEHTRRKALPKGKTFLQLFCFKMSASGQWLFILSQMLYLPKN